MDSTFDLLELLNNTNDLNLMVKIFSTLGVYLLTKNKAHDEILKSEALYKKLALVLKSGWQSKSLIALNLISALISTENVDERANEMVLLVHAKNMIRISGCLTVMCELFTSFMMYQETWKALCRSIAEACDGCIFNQSQCSYIMSLCVQRCQRGNLDPIIILQSLLSKNYRNIKIFFECNGMKIFKREFLQNPACLRLLNTIVEETLPENREEILKTSHLFRDLSYFLHKYGQNSSIGQWASIILFSYRKVLGTDLIHNEDECIHTQKNNNILPNYNKNTGDCISDTNNETNELLRNIFEEVISCRKPMHNNRPKMKLHNGYSKNNIAPQNIASQVSYKDLHTKFNGILNDSKEVKVNQFYKSPAMANANDVSFSFLYSKNYKDEKFQYPKNIGQPDQFSANHCQTYSDELRFKQSYNFKAYDISTIDRDDESTLNFKPPFVSTPKSSKFKSKKKQSSQPSREITISPMTDKITSNKTIEHRIKSINPIPANRGLRNRSMSAKLFDVLNGSCATLINGFKNIFSNNKNLVKTDYKSHDLSKTNMDKNNSCSYSFTNYMRRRDAILAKDGQNQDVTQFSKEFSYQVNDIDACNTCNDTIVLKNKLANDAFLQQTVKRLTLGINLYGCDFKKISKTLWPREAYMTPSVLYNLYRKLIVEK